MKKNILLTTLLSTGFTNAALTSIQNGDFETDVVYNLGVVAGDESSDSSVGSGSDWFETSTAAGNYRDVIANSGHPDFSAQFRDNGNIAVLNANTSYIYQNIGTLGSEAALNFTFDALERVQGNGGFTVNIELFSSSTFVGANGTDVEGAAGVTALGSGSYRFTSDSNLATNDDVIGASVSDLSLTGATSGEDIWVKVSTPRNPGDATLNIDNISYTVVPEPSSTALLGLAGLTFILRRRK